MAEMERFEPTGDALLIAVEHMARYLLASRFVEGHTVLDAACGTGYGATMLQRAGAASVMAVDIEPDAAVHFDGPVTGADLALLPFADNSFDRVVCFEAIEHVAAPGDALDEFARVLAPGGMLFISTPNRDHNVPGNPFHEFEFTFDEFTHALEKRFVHVKVLGQQPYAASSIGVLPASLRPSLDHVASRPLAALQSLPADGAQYMVAVASDHELPDIDTLTVLGDSVELRWWHQQLADSHAAANEAARREQVTITDHDALRNQIHELGARLLVAEHTAADVAPLRHEAEVLRANLAGSIDDNVGIVGRAERAERELAAIKATKTMRIVAPMRRVYGRMRRMAGRPT